MIVISESDIAELLDAVPSFQERWRKTEASDARYAADFPENAPAERANAFLDGLASHLGSSVGRGGLHEVECLSTALEKIFARLPEADAVKLTVAFMESLVYGIEHAGGDPGTVTPLMGGTHTRWRWRQALEYTRGTYLYDRDPEESDHVG